MLMVLMQDQPQTWEAVVKVDIVCKVVGVAHVFLNGDKMIWAQIHLGIVGHQLLALHGK
jgi:hypothetical protein